MLKLKEKQMLKITKLLLSTSTFLMAPIFAESVPEETSQDNQSSAQNTIASFYPYQGITSYSDNPTEATDKITEQKIDGSWGVIQPPKSPNKGAGVYATGDFLYWQSHLKGIEYAWKASSLAGVAELPDLVIPINRISGGKLQDAKQTFDPGFRLGLGYVFDYDFWDLNFTWTWLHMSNSTSVSAPSGGSVTPLWWIFSRDGSAATHASNKFKLGYDTFDLQLSRSYFVSKNLALAPIFGIRGATIDEHIHSKYSGDEYVINAFHTLGFFTTGGRSYYWGLGPRAGLDGQFCFNRNWSLFGTAAGMLLFGQYTVSMHGHFSGVDDHNLQPNFHTSDQFFRIKGCIDLALGLHWSSYFNCEKEHVDIALAYEFINWFHQNQFREFFGVALFNGGVVERTGSLTFQGLTLSAKVDF